MTLNLSQKKGIKFLLKTDKVFDSLILRGNSFHWRQTRTKKGILKSFCPTGRDVK